MATGFMTRYFFACGFAVLLLNPLVLKAADCSFSGSDGVLVDFGVVSSRITSEVVGLGQLDFMCTPDGMVPEIVSYSISISEGGSGDFSQRILQFAGQSIDYNLYVTAGGAVVIGDGNPVNGTQTLSGVCTTGITCSQFVNGRINANQIVNPGSYQDTVIVTLTF